MDTKKLTSWGEAVDFTFKTRDAWRNGASVATNTYNCQHFTNCVGNSFPLSKITPMVMNQACIDLEEERSMSDSTINRVISAVSTVLNHCSSMGMTDITPPKFKRRKEGEHRLTWFTKDEVETMYSAAMDPFSRDDVAAITIVAAYTGMRQGELLKLRMQDIDLGTGQIYIGGREGFQTKARNFRAVPIHERIKPIIANRSEYAAHNAMIFGDDWPGGKDQLIRAFKKVRNYSIKKDDKWTFHSLRHTFATWCAEAGVPIRTLMGLMGHSNVETTLRYAKVTDQARYDAISAI
jgi:integrase